MKPYIYGQWRCQEILKRKEQSFQQVVLGQMDIHIKKKKDDYHMLYTKIKSKLITYMWELKLQNS